MTWHPFLHSRHPAICFHVRAVDRPGNLQQPRQGAWRSAVPIYPPVQRLYSQSE